MIMLILLLILICKLLGITVFAKLMMFKCKLLGSETEGLTVEIYGVIYSVYGFLDLRPGTFTGFILSFSSI